MDKKLEGMKCKSHLFRWHYTSNSQFMLVAEPYRVLSSWNFFVISSAYQFDHSSEFTHLVKLITELWSEFHSLPLDQISTSRIPPLVISMKNIYIFIYIKKAATVVHKGGYFCLPKPLLYIMIWYNTMVIVNQLSNQCCGVCNF